MDWTTLTGRETCGGEQRPHRECAGPETGSERTGANTGESQAHSLPDK